MTSNISRRDFLKIGGTVIGTGIIGASLPELASAAPARNGGITWPKDQALPTFSPPYHLDFMDASELDEDVQVLLTTMQGTVARRTPSIYLWFSENDAKEGWLNTLSVPYTEYSDPWKLIAKYSNQVRGTVVYDPNVWDSLNVATTLAGLESGVVASPELAQKISGAPYNIPVIADLRGKFTSKLDAYTWQYEHLWPRTTHRMLTGISPNQKTPTPPGIPPYYTTVIEETRQIRDSSNRQVYSLDLSQFATGDAVYLRFDDSFPNDGWGPSVQHVTVTANGQIIADFEPFTDAEATYLYDSDGSSRDGSHRFADGNNYFVYQFPIPQGTTDLVAQVDMWNEFKVSATNTQPPTSDIYVPFPRFRDYIVANQAMVFWLDPNVPEERALFEKIMDDVEPYTPYMGWFAQDVAGEFSGTQLCSEHSVYVLAADFFDNGTVFAGVRARVPMQRPHAAPALENKVYVTLVMTEGDNIQYCQHRLRQIWDDPGRGKVPLTWTVDPLLLDAGPAMIGYYERTATANDLLMAGPSGAGYIYPTPWPDSTFRSFTKASAKYMRRLGIDTVYVLNRLNNQSVALSDSEVSDYLYDVQPRGIMLNFEGYTEVSILDGTTPQAIIRGAGNAQDARNIIEEESANWDGSSPLFLAIGVIAWNATPTDIANAMSTLGPDYEIVLSDQFFDLVSESYGV